MKTHVVEPIVLTLTEDTLPRSDVGGRKACLGETAVPDGATKVYGLTVEQDVATTHGNFTEAEGDADRLTLIMNGSGVELGMVFAPWLGIGNMDVESLIVEGNVNGTRSQVRDDTLPVDTWSGTQLYATCDAVPVALRLVRDAVGVLTYTDILYAVVNANGDFVLPTIVKVRSDVILMRHAEAHLMAYVMTVDRDGGLDVRTLEEEGDTLAAPRLGNDDAATVDGFTHEVLIGREEERKLHLTSMAIRLHEGVEVIAGVVERTRPTRVDGKVVTQAIGEEGTWKGDGCGVQARSEVPSAGEVDDVLRRGIPKTET